MASYDSYLKTYTDYYKKKWDEDIAKSNKMYEQQKADIKNNYAGQISEVSAGYDDAYRQNAVQQEVNKRQIEENMANLGLTDSGLNRTQETATQLSYANNKAKLDQNRQLSIDKLNREMASMLSSVDINASNAGASINANYQKMIADAANDAYKTDVAAETARQKALLDAQTARIKAASSSSSKSSGGGSTKTIKNKGFDTAAHMEAAVEALKNGDFEEYDRLIKYYYTQNDETDAFWNDEAERMTSIYAPIRKGTDAIKSGIKSASTNLMSKLSKSLRLK